MKVKEDDDPEKKTTSTTNTRLHGLNGNSFCDCEKFMEDSYTG
jgi:hypothetical protein